MSISITTWPFELFKNFWKSWTICWICVYIYISNLGGNRSHVCESRHSSPSPAHVLDDSQMMIRAYSLLQPITSADVLSRIWLFLARSEWCMQWSIGPCFGYVVTKRIITGLVFTTACQRADCVCVFRETLTNCINVLEQKPWQLSDRHDTTIWCSFGDVCCFFSHAFLSPDIKGNRMNKVHTPSF